MCLAPDGGPGGMRGAGVTDWDAPVVQDEGGEVFRRQGFSCGRVTPVIAWPPMGAFLQ